MNKELVEAMNEAMEAEAVEVTEVTTEKNKKDKPKKTEWVRPADIRIKSTKTGEVIMMEATGEHSYDKSYYPTMGGKLRRVKHVKLPVSLDKIKFNNVNELFNYLLESGCYVKA